MPPKSTHATIYQVASEAGVAISTVSKVLSNKSGVSTETRARVKQAVERLGYAPSLAARGLSRGHTGIVAAIYAFPPKLLFTDPYLLKNLLGIKETLDEAEYTLLLTTAKEDDPTSSFDRLIRSRYFDGAIIMETTEIRKFALYQKLVRLEKVAGIDLLRQEFSDRFGPLPRELENLLYAVKIKLLASRVHLESVGLDEGEIVLRRFEGMRFSREKMEPFLRGLRLPLGSLHFDPLAVRVHPKRIGDTWPQVLEEVIRRVA